MRHVRLFRISSRIALLGAFVAALFLFGRISFSQAARSADPTRVHNTKGVSSSCGAWAVTFSPNPSTTVNVFEGVAAVSTNDVWAAGYYKDNSNFAELTLIEHWNGSRWSISPSPNTGTNSFFFGVAASSVSNAWAVGAYEDSKGALHALTEQWNGSTWSVVPSPNVSGSFSDVLFASAALSTDNVWTVGYDVNSSGLPQTLTEQWNGSSWSVVPSANKGTHSNILSGVAAISKTGGVWAVGSYTLKTGSHAPSRSLTEFYC